jgi:hypothetical protein
MLQGQFQIAVHVRDIGPDRPGGCDNLGIDIDDALANDPRQTWQG